MELYKLTTPKDDAWKVIEMLGNENLVQFLNMNLNVDVTKLLYTDRIKSCDDTERRILFLLNTCNEYFIKINKPADSAQFNQIINFLEQRMSSQADMLFDAIEGEVRSCEDFVVKQRDTIEEIQLAIDWQKDYAVVIDFLIEMMSDLGGAVPANVAGGHDTENPGGVMGGNSSLSFYAGTIRADE